MGRTTIRTLPVLLAAISLAAATPSVAALGDCGQPLSNGSNPVASDCLHVLRSAVGSASCELCVCDTNGSSSILAFDALLCLRKAVGQNVTLSCPPCTTTTTTTTSTTTTTLPPGTEGNPGLSCRHILAAGASSGSGVYWLSPSGAEAYESYCDMTTDGGGWTTLFAGPNGSPNVFDHFDAGLYDGICSDEVDHCLRRADAALDSSAAEVLVSCGASSVKFPLTRALQDFFVSGTRSGWKPITATLLSGSTPNVPNSFWTGEGPLASFIVARNQGSGANAFASSYSSSTSFDYCAGVFDQSSLVRIAYRESEPEPVHNTPATAGASCLAILDADGSEGDGNYWIQPAGEPAPLLAYCDMSSDGGGWTTIFAGRNGSENVFGHFDEAGSEQCGSPSTKCLRYAPESLGDAEIAVACASAMVKFPLTQGVRGLLTSGTRAAWQAVDSTVVSGSVANLPNSFWTGAAGNSSFILARDQSGGANGFASSYSTNTAFDYCNGVSDQGSIVRISYRETAAPPVHNEPGDARKSCLAILEAGESEGDGLYWIDPVTNDPALLAYCDMTTDGGGWTALFAGRNGSVNVFDYFDSGFYDGVCPDPAGRCLRRAPSTLAADASELAVACGAAMVRFPLTAAVRSWLMSGTQGDWQALAPTVIAGSVPNPPNGVYTGNVGVRSFIFARNQGGGANTFASSFDASASYDYCNGAFDRGSRLRLFYR